MRIPKGPRGYFLPIALSVALILRVALAVGLKPASDVYYYLTQSAEALLSGGNPYLHTFSGIPADLLTPGAQRVFAYLPASALYSVPFYLAGNVLIGLIAGDLVVGTCLYLRGGRWSPVAATVFLFLPPTLLFSTLYPNVAVIAMAFIAAFVLLESRGYSVAGAVCLGVAFATVQFSLLLLPCVVFYYAKERRWVEPTVALAVAGLIVIPFLIASPSAFVYDTVSFQFTRAVAPLVGGGAPFGFTVNPSLDAVAIAASGVPVPAYVRAAIELVMVGLSLRVTTMRSLVRNAAILVAASSFVLPSDFFWSYLELPFMLVLFWLSSPPKDGEAATAVPKL